MQPFDQTAELKFGLGHDEARVDELAGDILNLVM